jgi:hypothetical protein
MQNLHFRRQYILLGNSVQKIDGWKEEIIRNKLRSWYLYYHPDLKVTRNKNSFFQLVLIGYILDPEKTTYTDEDILNDLLQNTSYEQLLKDSDKYNGRFVLLCIEDENMKIVNDATGFREVYYTFHNNSFACGSTPDIIAKFSGIGNTKDQDVLDFFNSDELKQRDHVWIGYKTIFENILHLPPNHYLNVETRKYIRFWPFEPIHTISIEKCAEECAAILKGTIESAANRYELHMGITAGWDTRLLLAASKNVKDKIFYYINKVSTLDESSPDLQISKRLDRLFDLNLKIIDIKPEIDPEFEDIFYSNNSLAHDKLLAIFYNVYIRKWDSTYTISGTMGNGLARIYFRIPEGHKLTGKNIAALAGYSKNKYVVDSLKEWITNVSSTIDEFNINIMDLYQLEQDNTNWASLTASEQDIVREEIRPFNNRNLIRLFWSLDSKYRFQNFPEIYVRIMEILWMDVLVVPCNPSNKSWLFAILRTMGFEQKIYYLKKKLEFHKTIRSYRYFNHQ